MKKLVLFRYHNNFDICIENLKTIKKYNPSVQIAGMYGGDLDTEIPQELLSLMNTNYKLPFEDAYYK